MASKASPRPPQPPGRPRMGCSFCSRRKRKCTFPGDGGPCDECSARGIECVQPDPNVSRRQRERLERIEQQRQLASVVEQRRRSSASSANSPASPPSAQLASAPSRSPAAGHAAMFPPFAPYPGYSPAGPGGPPAPQGYPFPGAPAFPPFYNPPLGPAGHHQYFPQPSPPFLPSPSQPQPWNPEPPAFSRPFHYPSPAPGYPPQQSQQQAFPPPLPAGRPPQQDATSLAQAVYGFAPRNEDGRGKMGLALMIGGEDAPPPDLIEPALEAFWHHTHSWGPIVHRATFTAALARPCPVYRRRPLALLHAMAAHGVREAAAVPELDRERWARWHADRAAGELDAHFAGTGSGATPLEVVQATLILVMFRVAGGDAEAGLGILWRAASTVRGMCFHPGGAWKPADPSLPPHVGWAEEEMRARALLGYFSSDVTFSYHARRTPALDYRAVAFRMPCHQAYFDASDPEAAFALLPPGGMPEFRVGPLVDGPPEARRAVLEASVGRAFEGGATWQALSAVASSMRLARVELRALQEAAGIDVYALAAKHGSESPEALDASEEAYLRGTAALDDIVAGVNALLPPELRGVADGDARPLYAHAARALGAREHAGGALISLVSLHTARVQSWIGPEVASTARFGTDLPFASSPRFLAVLESSLLVARLLATALDADPDLTGVHFAALPGVLAAGAVAIAAWRMHAGLGAGEGYEWDASAVGRFLEVLGRRYRPYGTQFCKEFRRMLEDAGMGEQMPGEGGSGAKAVRQASAVE